MNNYEFWEKYLKDVKSAVRKICREKSELHIDLHIHSNYSADGKQSLNQILETTKEKGFDIISITDHDTLKVYDELYEIVKNGITTPIIIPGIEFTVDNREYGNQCHMLQLFINPKDVELERNVDINYNAMFNRSKIHFKRLNDNLAIQEIIKKKKFKISYEEYIEYLINNGLVPEYDTICFYLIDKFKKVGVTTFDVLSLLEKYNKKDVYPDRMKLKTLRYRKLREKYEYSEKYYYNSRFLLSMLAVREVDDDWWDKPSCGSLSVNSYGQITVEKINEKYKIFFAHPTENSLGVVEKIINNKKNIIGLEHNIRNEYINIENLYNLINKYKLLKIYGSDSHDNSLKFYEDMNFYKISSEEIIKIVEAI